MKNKYVHLAIQQYLHHLIALNLVAIETTFGQFRILQQLNFFETF